MSKILSIKSEKVTENNSGVYPTGYRVVLKMDSVEQKTDKGIILPQETIDMENGGIESGRLVATGAAAFTIGISDLPKEWDIQPKIGARVMINRYAGVQFDGKDEAKYRILSDKEIIAIIEE